MKPSRKKLIEIITELTEDIKNIVYIRKQLSDDADVILLNNSRNKQRLIEACDKIQFELETTIERYMKD